MPASPETEITAGGGVVTRESGLRIRFCGLLCPSSAAAFQRCLAEAAAESFISAVPGEPGPPVVVLLQSDGGDVFSGLACMDAIETCPARVVVVAEGMVASAATFLLLGASRRLARPSACFMIHQVSSRLPGTPLGPEELRDELANSTTISNQLADLYTARTSMSPERVSELMKREVYLRAEDARGEGLVHSLIYAPPRGD